MERKELMQRNGLIDALDELAPLCTESPKAFQSLMDNINFLVDSLILFKLQICTIEDENKKLRSGK